MVHFLLSCTNVCLIYAEFGRKELMQYAHMDLSCCHTKSSFVGFAFNGLTHDCLVALDFRLCFCKLKLYCDVLCLLSQRVKEYFPSVCFHLIDLRGLWLLLSSSGVIS